MAPHYGENEAEVIPCFLVDIGVRKIMNVVRYVNVKTMVLLV